jgi:hypothetical protein
MTTRMMTFALLACLLWVWMEGVTAICYVEGPENCTFQTNINFAKNTSDVTLCSCSKEGGVAEWIFSNSSSMAKVPWAKMVSRERSAHQQSILLNARKQVLLGFRLLFLG